jgi:hypothetical protein
VATWTSAQSLYQIRRDRGEKLVQGGESDYYLYNQQRLERGYQAEKEGRRMQLGALAIFGSPVIGFAIVEAAPAIAYEASLMRTGAQMVGRKFGMPFIGASMINYMQNVSKVNSFTLEGFGKAAKKMDAFDITVGTVAPGLGYTGFSSVVGISAINSLVDVSPLAPQSERISYLGSGKNIFQVGFDFSFNLLGEGAKYTYGTLGGTSELMPVFTDIIVGNTGGAVQDQLGNMQDDKSKK